MDKEQFLKSLSETKDIYNWSINEENEIRFYESYSGHNLCPLEAVLFYLKGEQLPSWLACGRRLEINDWLAMQIVYGSENNNLYWETNFMRSKILTALGL